MVLYALQAVAHSPCTSYLQSKREIIKTTKSIKRISANPPYAGRRTSHHDQLIYAVNFSAIKRIVSKPKKPMPDDDDDDVLDIFFVFKVKDNSAWSYMLLRQSHIAHAPVLRNRRNR